MKEILSNLANVLLINYCKEHNIDCSGTHLEKVDRKFTYRLMKTETNERVAVAVFRKNTAPSLYV